MEISQKSINNYVIVQIDGNIASHETQEMRKYFEPIIEDINIQGIIINCEKVKYIDSAGLGLVVSIYRTLNMNKKQFAISAINENVMKIFELTKLNKILTFAEDDKSALEILGSDI